jgi:hypothetical protein
MEFEKSIEGEEDEHEERQDQRNEEEEEIDHNPFRGEAIDLRTALEQELIKSRQQDQGEAAEEDESVSEFSQTSLELLHRIRELEDNLRLMHPSIVPIRMVTSDSDEDHGNREEEEKEEDQDELPEPMPK